MEVQSILDFIENNPPLFVVFLVLSGIVIFAMYIVFRRTKKTDDSIQTVVEIFTKALADNNTLLADTQRQSDENTTRLVEAMIEQNTNRDVALAIEKQANAIKKQADMMKESCSEAGKTRQLLSQAIEAAVPLAKDFKAQLDIISASTIDAKAQASQLAAALHKDRQIMEETHKKVEVIAENMAKQSDLVELQKSVDALSELVTDSDLPTLKKTLEELTKKVDRLIEKEESK